MQNGIQELIVKVLIQQSNDVLDCIEGKISILEITSLLGSEFDDTDRLAERLRKIRKEKICE